MQNKNWIGVDWGSTNMRVFLMSKDNKLLDKRQSDKGVARLQSDQFETEFLAMVSDWLTEGETHLVYAIGMVGARQGWCDSGYRQVPCRPLARKKLTSVAVKDTRICVWIASGLMQSDPPDVMRGEETQIAGFLRMEPWYSGVICLPGTHSKWVQIERSEVVKFQTFMTGEVFDLLSSQSVLQHSVGDQGWDDTAFLDAALRAIQNPIRAAAELFSLRASDLLYDIPSPKLRATLSGVLIGQELGLSRSIWTGQHITAIGAPSTMPLYAQVLREFDHPTTQVDARSATLSGLTMLADSHGSLDCWSE